MNAIKNITVGHTERLRKPVGYTMLANLVNIVRSHKCDFPYV